MQHTGQALEKKPDSSCCGHQPDIAATDSMPPAADASAYYVCPMHPQIRQLGPGNCPACGMALDHESLITEPGHNSELIDMQRRFAVTALVSLPFVLMMTVPPVHHFLRQPQWLWVQALLATIAVVWGGWPFFT